MFEHYRSRIEAIGRRPFLRAGIQALTSKWEQNNEPPPAPPQIEPDATQTPWKREAQEEDYFNASDDEEVTEQPKSKKPKDVWFGNRNKRSPVATKSSKFEPRSSPRQNTSGRRSRFVIVSNQSTVATTPKSGPAASEEDKPSLGLDYDDGSDSDTSSNGNQSPRTTNAPPLADTQKLNTEVTEELEEDLMDVTMKMRAKRQREEEDDADFAGLFGSLSKAGASGDAKKKAPLVEGSSKSSLGTSTATATSEGSASDTILTAQSITPDSEDKKAKEKEVPVPESGATTTGKRLKLNFGFGRKAK